MMSACGVLCSDCPAYQASSKGKEYQNQVVEAWHRIYGLNETPERISCGGCLGPDEQVFYTSRECKARQCCKLRGYQSCAECAEETCAYLEQAQSVWDDVPMLEKILTPADFETYARPYCSHRKRLADARTIYKNR